jgi:hypothetical protein
MKKSVIYKIVFQDGTVYVGQTQDWDKRKKEHQRAKGRGSPKLKAAFEIDPDPAFYVIEETQDLDNREVYWIDKLKPELNVLPGGEAMRGLNHPRAHYTREQIQEVVNQWTTTAAKITDISRATGVNLSTCNDIVHGRSHCWATEGIDLRAHDRVHHWKIWDPFGNVYEANTIRELEAKTGISSSSIYSIINSKKGVGANGWTAHPTTMITLTDPNHNTFQISTTLAKTLLIDHGLSKYQIDRLTKQFKPSAGWKSTVCPGNGIDFL